MSPIRLYIDEDAMHDAIILSLRSRNVDVVSATDAEMINRIDDDQLMTATGLDRVLYSYNIKDYQRIHGEWLVKEQTHAGIIVAVQQRYSVGEELSRLTRMINELSAGNMRDRLEYLGNWG